MHFLLKLLSHPVFAQVYNSPCDNPLKCGFDYAAGIVGQSTDLRTLILNVLKIVLGFMALVAAIAIIIAGIFLVGGGGTDTSKEKAKKLILFTVIGLVVIMLARLAVEFVISTVK